MTPLQIAVNVKQSGPWRRLHRRMRAWRCSASRMGRRTVEYPAEQWPSAITLRLHLPARIAAVQLRRRHRSPVSHLQLKRAHRSPSR